MTPTTAFDAETVSRLRAALGRTARQLRGTDAGRDLTPSQLSVLGTLSRTGGLPMADLARVEAVNPTMLSRLVGKLEARGLVVRSPDPQDRRAVHVSVSPAGRALTRRVRTERTRHLTQHLDALDPEQARALLEALPALEALASSLRGDDL